MTWPPSSVPHDIRAQLSLRRATKRGQATQWIVICMLAKIKASYMHASYGLVQAKPGKTKSFKQRESLSPLSVDCPTVPTLCRPMERISTRFETCCKLQKRSPISVTRILQHLLPRCPVHCVYVSYAKGGVRAGMLKHTPSRHSKVLDGRSSNPFSTLFGGAPVQGPSPGLAVSVTSVD